MRMWSAVVACLVGIAPVAVANEISAEDVPVPVTLPAVSLPPPGAPACVVDLYDRWTMDRGRVRVQGPVEIASLEAIAFDNGKSVEDRVHGIRTGPFARIELFWDEGFIGPVHRVFEGTQEPLDRNSFWGLASSMKVSCVPAAPVDTAGCWANLHSNSYTQDKVRIQGPAEYPEFEGLAFRDGENLRNDIRAVTTGPSAKLELFAGRDFEHRVHRTFPSTTEALVRPGMSHDTFSLRLSCGPSVAADAPPRS